MTKQNKTVGEASEAKETPVEVPSAIAKFDDVKFPIEIKLPSGGKWVIKEFKAKHSANAEILAGNNLAMMNAAIMAETGTLDGRKLVPEEIYNDMDGRDYNRLYIEYGKRGFL